MGRPAIDLGGLHRFGFLTLPNYSMVASSNALEACRMANYVAGRAVYSWQVLALDGAAVPASNGLSLHPTMRLEGAGPPLDILFVCGGIDVRHAVDRRLKDALRRVGRNGVALGALCTGTFALAEAGLLDGYCCAIHWENLAAVREEFARVSFVEDLFVVDRNRFTCTGGVAPLHMMLSLIEARLGKDAAARVSDQLILERPRLASDRQHVPLRARLGADYPALTQAARIMEEAVETPIAIAAVAAAVGLSARQLERLFRRHLGLPPSRFYRSLRLTRARELLRLTAMSVTDVGLACGFQSTTHFSTAYGRQFGHSPRAERTM